MRQHKGGKIWPARFVSRPPDLDHTQMLHFQLESVRVPSD
jgi:hypothetical protein